MNKNVFEDEILESNAVLQTLSDTLYLNKGIRVSMLRLDRIHPFISGNKWFKLRFHLEKYHTGTWKGIITAGGAFSNHLHATAFAGKLAGIPTAALIRGEEPASYSPTLQDLKDLGMQLHFLDRESYANSSTQKEIVDTLFKDYYFIPEGGFSEEGLQGASTILTQYNLQSFSHLACAAGTGTMMAGLLRTAEAHQHIIGIPVLKISNEEDNSLVNLMKQQTTKSTFSLHYHFHQGGYAKKNDVLVAFMNQFFQQHQIPLDVVYTAKLLKGLETMIAEDYFPKGANICILHSGGLQGNRSFNKGDLIF